MKHFILQPSFLHPFFPTSPSSWLVLRLVRLTDAVTCFRSGSLPVSSSPVLTAFLRQTNAIFTLLTGEWFGHDERFAGYGGTFNAASAMNDQFIFFAQFINTENRDKACAVRR